jgi:hypothetical protein
MRDGKDLNGKNRFVPVDPAFMNELILAVKPSQD